MSDSLQAATPDNTTPEKSLTGRHDMRASYYLRVNSAASLLFAESWAMKGYDWRLREALTQSLLMVKGTGVVAHVTHARITISCFVDFHPEDERRIAAQIVDRAQQWFRQGGGRPGQEILMITLDERLKAAVVAIPAESRDESLDGSDAAYRHDTARPTRPTDFCAMVYDVAGRWRAQEHAPLPHEEERFVQTHGRSTIRMLFDVISGRVRRFAPFAPEVSARYWEDSRFHIRSDRGTVPAEALRPPWELNEPTRTATLSLDLRKSTFCMEQADDPVAFARWLNQLVRLLYAVGHLHGGAFDKFTGDGALVHFLERECRVIYGRNPVEAAIACAGDMQRVVNHHVDLLRDFLRMDSVLLGAGIGVDIADAFWSIDHRDNPVLVGRGIVGACRLCARATAGRVILSNIAFRELSADLRRNFERVPLMSKEFREEMQVMAWQNVSRDSPLGVSAAEKIDEILNDVYRDRRPGRGGGPGR